MKVKMIFKSKEILGLSSENLSSLLHRLKEYCGVELDYTRSAIAVVAEECDVATVRQIVEEFTGPSKIQISWPDEGHEFDDVIPVKVAERQFDSRFDFSVKGIECQNELIRKKLKDLERLTYWMISRYNVSPSVLAKHIISAISNIYMEYNPAKFSERDIRVGDVVFCTYGRELNGEIRGAEIPTIVVDIAPQNMFFGVPVIGESTFEGKMLQMENFEYVVPEFDVEHFNIAVPEMGRYMKMKRITGKAGRMNSSAFEEIVEMLRESHDFSYNILYNY